MDGYTWVFLAVDIPLFCNYNLALKCGGNLGIYESSFASGNASALHFLVAAAIVVMAVHKRLSSA